MKNNLILWYYNCHIQQVNFFDMFLISSQKLTELFNFWFILQKKGFQ